MFYFLTARHLELGGGKRKEEYATFSWQAQNLSRLVEHRTLRLQQQTFCESWMQIAFRLAFVKVGFQL
jgi:hypothetical protein